MDPKEISLHFLLNINEDFDDDLLQDVVELLHWLYQHLKSYDIVSKQYETRKLIMFGHLKIQKKHPLEGTMSTD